MQPALLIVDDEPQLLRLLVRVFEREGYGVVAVADGEAATAALAEAADELVAVVLDVFIPPDGAEAVLDAVQTHRPGLGVVVVSGDQLEAGLEARVQAVGGSFLRKPFRPDALIEAVRRVAGAPDGGAAP